MKKSKSQKSHNPPKVEVRPQAQPMQQQNILHSHQPLQHQYQHQQQQYQQIDIYFQGSPDELFTLLYPLTSPQSPIFQHLSLSSIQYQQKSTIIPSTNSSSPSLNNNNPNPNPNPNIMPLSQAQVDKNLSFTYKIKQFTNIDKQIQSIKYSSTCLPTHSNYFYSTPYQAQPNRQALIWRSVNRILQLRPSPSLSTPVPVPNATSAPAPTSNININADPNKSSKILEMIQISDYSNKSRKQIQALCDHIREGTVNAQPNFRKNFDIGSEEYMMRLCQ